MDVVDGNSNYQGMRITLIIMNSFDILEGVKMLMMITTNFVERLHEEATDSDYIEQRTDVTKGYWNHRYIINPESSLLFKAK